MAKTLSQPAGDLTIRPLHAGDDLDAEFDLRHRAFGPMSSSGREIRLAELRAAIADSRLYGVWDGADGARLLGSACFHDLRQWWHGRALPMAGVAGVKVAPEVRGRGVGRALMTALLGAMAERGYPISVLYPSTAPIYHSLGWEIAGGLYQAEVAGRSLGSLLPPDAEVPDAPDAEGELQPDAPRSSPAQSGPAQSGPAQPPCAVLPPPGLRRASADDADEVIAVISAVHAYARDCGPCTFDADSVRRWFSPDVFAYLAADGFLAYGWDGSGDIAVHALEAASAGTVRSLWGIVASHASMAKTVRATVGPHDPIGWLTREPDVSLRLQEWWMLRVLHPRAAIAGRGFPATAEASVPLLLTDPDLPANAGLHTLSVGGGQGSLTRGLTGAATASPAPPPVMLGPRGFAALFAGTPMVTLRMAGLAAGGDAGTDGVLDAAFAGMPYLLDYF